MRKVIDEYKVAYEDFQKKTQAQMEEKATIYDLRRMCKTFSQCVGCPLRFGACDIREIKSTSDKRFETLNAIVSNWCKEHPVKTRQDKFLEMFPNASMHNTVIDICPCKVDHDYDCKNTIGRCRECKKSYWLAEVEE